MENEQENQTQPIEENSLVYIVGAVIVVAVVVAGVIMWPKTKTMTQEKEITQTQTTPATKTLTKLTCDNEWYNPVIGMPKYYLSASGGDVLSGNIECIFTVTNATGTAVLTEKVVVTTTPAPDRNGNTFSCTTKALEKIPQNTPVKLVAAIKNDEGQTASCGGTVTFR